MKICKEVCLVKTSEDGGIAVDVYTVLSTALKSDEVPKMAKNALSLVGKSAGSLPIQ